MSTEKSECAPHACTKCDAPAYLPFHGPPRCTSKRCEHYDQELWVEHIMSLPDSGDPPEQLRLGYCEDEDTGLMMGFCDDEDTEPQGPKAKGFWIDSNGMVWWG